MNYQLKIRELFLKTFLLFILSFWIMFVSVLNTEQTITTTVRQLLNITCALQLLWYIKKSSKGHELLIYSQKCLN